ncbi:response regulator transcription factor [Shewanella sp. CG12_big_fil_rev_8_21_14_0_65_47_15]|uniref:response regulator n=1 Tax=Shewanella sp. CG12_big_fil_rev_8_21_14_0_65_47_15 TaxID=1975537 RepID=UPI000CB26AA5|nr:response regulator transcription factor [Shewanella sp. CG12_big_fil_rev_8_21_14_0_65_47_15]PIW59270.1 MAG: DNA-binding response regulator [Shewanella sp. CG12_big_fil_rev_8_21_14_0_65_47_15]
MIRILLADDHAIVREGIKRMFQLTADVTVVHEASNGGELLELLRTAEVDLILLDMSMPGVSGANLITRIVANFPAIPVLVLSMHNEPQIARRALNAGAAGYLTKDSEPEQLLTAIRRIAQGKRYIDPELAEQMVFASSHDKGSLQHEQLSEREFEIMLLLAKGISLNEIAEQLAISSKTVSTHKMRLMKKLSLNSNADLVRYAIAHQLIA